MVMEHVGDVMFHLSKHYLEEIRGWSRDFVTRDGYPSPRCNAADKERFIKSVMR